MTKEEVLQKVNDYCTEKQYTNATLTDGFKDKFADHFQKANPDADIESEDVLANMKFALNTAFSGASEIITEKVRVFESKENGYKKQIDELRKQLKNQQPDGGNNDDDGDTTFQLPDDVKDQLRELKEFKDEKTKQEKFKNICKIAKQGIRQDLHASFDKFALDYDVTTDEEDKDQAAYLVGRFQDIFKDSIGNIKPKAPVQTQKQDEEFLAQIPKVKVR